ncbi:penicillin-binding protein, beta-lactamase class C [Caulobacter sp. AP07]|uniref:serine hydrolase domain-containing protein n=1 Tax=Caulobacter sp. AP07 TaxID=1144304 RepID=UPI0002720C7B|nr:serine hydrolase domain-containing protein [Caulobacter sp. AP07]EJL25231.1 penicillin-binding protein, beta-lactamase class C [Caulobacter sp. AP07]
MAPVVTAAPEEVGLSADGLAKVDAAVQAQIDAGTIAGAVTLVARHGRVCHVHAMGLQNIEAGQASRIDGLYRIFSMTKPVTAVAMMILWDEGLWRPEDPIDKHLPEFAGARVLAGLEADGSTRLEPAAHPPTLLKLLTHTAGLSYGTALSDPNDPIDKAYRAAQVWQAGDLAQMMARLGPLPLAYQPGTSWRYSIGMDVQGALIERLTGQSLPQFMQDRIFAPLGMTDTAFHTPPEKADRLAALYLKAGDAPLTAIANPLRPDCDAPPRLAMGGGGLVSTIGDYARFAQMLLGKGELDGRRIISPQAATLMMSNHLPDALMEKGFVAGHQRIRPGFGFGFNGVVFTDPQAAGVPVGQGTYQWDGAAGTFFWVDPANDLLLVTMTQHLSYAAPPLQAQTQVLMAEAIMS